MRAEAALIKLLKIMLESIQNTTAYIKSRIGDFKPQVGIILGTGLGGLVNEIEVEKQLMYSNIPDFPISTLEFHSGKLIFGKLNGVSVVAMQGRLHYYEGYNMQQITFPVRVLKMLGIETLFVALRRPGTVVTDIQIELAIIVIIPKGRTCRIT